jgi:hypothetical protein
VQEESVKELNMGQVTISVLGNLIWYILKFSHILGFFKAKMSEKAGLEGWIAQLFWHWDAWI